MNNSNLSRHNGIGEAPNYFTATMIMLGVNLGWIFVALWLSFGFIIALAAAALTNSLINLLEARSAPETVPPPTPRRK